MRFIPSAAVVASVFGLCASPVAIAAACTEKIEPSRAYLQKVDRLTRKLKATQAAKADFRSRLMANATTGWVCSPGDDCCKDIPLTVAKAASSTTSCQATVAFPYSQLRIKRDGGGHKPPITWLLKFDGVNPDYQFGSSGIKIEIMGGYASPVHTQGPEKCKLGATTDQFTCKANGKKAAQAGHIANVYPKTNVDDPKFRCDNIDPLIVNVEN